MANLGHCGDPIKLAPNSAQIPVLLCKTKQILFNMREQQEAQQQQQQQAVAAAGGPASMPPRQPGLPHSTPQQVSPSCDTHTAQSAEPPWVPDVAAVPAEADAPGHDAAAADAVRAGPAWLSAAARHAADRRDAAPGRSTDAAARPAPAATVLCR